MARGKRYPVKSTPQARATARAGQRARAGLGVVAVLYLLVAGLYVGYFPPGKGPDETAHLRYVQYLAEHHHLPTFSRTNPGADYEFHQPPLYYALALPFYLLGGSSLARQGYLVRAFTALLGLVLLGLTYALADSMVPGRPWTALSATALAAFLPMHLALVTSASNDALTEIFFAAALLLLVQHLRAAAAYRAGGAPPGLRGPALLGVMIGLGLLTKSLAIMLFPVAWLGVLLAGRGPERYEWRRVLRDGAVATGVALLFAGWWLVRNQMLYGDPLAQHAFLTAFQDRPSPQAMMRLGGLTPVAYVGLVMMWTLASMLGIFGPVSGNHFVFYPWGVYVLAGLVALAGALGFVRAPRRSGAPVWVRHAWWLCEALGLLLLLGFIVFNLTYFQAQARYMFPVLPAAALALCLGLEQLAPPRVAAWVPLTVSALVGLLALAGLGAWILPEFS